MKQTASQTVGPFFRIGLIYGEAQNNLVDDETQGERIIITGRVLDGDGEPIPDAMVEIWQPDAKGIFKHPADPRHDEADPHFRGFGRAETIRGGRYEFRTIRPGGRDGGAPYINVHIFSRGMLIHAMTRIYFSDAPANVQDTLLNSVDGKRRHTLIAERDDSGDLPIYHFDIRFHGEDETVFFDP